MKSYPVNRVKQVFKMLSIGRADLAVHPRNHGFIFLKNAGIIDIEALEPPLEQNLVYHYLNKKHEDLIPKLTEILKEMQSSGELLRLQKEVMAEKLN